MKPNTIALFALVFIGALSRLIPHPYNFTPIGGIALLSAAYCTRRSWAFLIPLVAMYISDLILNNIVFAELHGKKDFSWGIIPGVYISIGLITLMGILTLQKVTPMRLFLAGIGSSLLFFLISNFETWAFWEMYPKNIAGLVACYTAAIPFYWNTLAGDLTYITVLFGAYYWLFQRQNAHVVNA